MLSMQIKDSIRTAIRTVASDAKCIYEDEMLVIYQKNWGDFPSTDVIGFAPLFTIDDANQWKKSEALFLNSIPDCIYEDKAMSVEPTLAFLYEPELYDKFLKHIFTIERDEIHCRKYTIPVNNDLSEEIIRLPIANFKNSIFKSLLPQSARKALFTSGLKLDFINGVLKQSKLSSIINNVEMNFKGKKLATHPQNEVLDTETLPRTYTRLTELKIEGFRAYGDAYNFDLNADLIVIAGPNGSGKTSFFDALDFAATGSVKRFGQDQSMLPNLDQPNNLKVSLGVESNDNGIINKLSIERDINQVLLDGKLTDRKDVLLRLTQTEIKENIDRITQLFRASHMANQYQAELTEKVRKDSSIPNDLVGRMLSLEDYVLGINRIHNAMEQVKKANIAIDLEIGGYRSTLSEIEGDIASFTHDLEKRPSLKSYSTFEEIANTAADLNIDTTERDLDAISDLKSLRIKLEEILAENDAQYNRTLGAIELLMDKEKYDQKNKAIDESIINCQIEKNTLENEFSIIFKKILEKESKYESFLTKIKEFEITRNNIDWMNMNYDQWINKNRSLENLYQKLNFIESEKTALENPIEEYSKEEYSLRDKLSETKQKVVQIQEKLVKVHNIKQKLPNYLELLSSHSIFQANIAVLEKDIAGRQGLINKNQKEVSSSQSKFSSIKEKLNREMSNSSHLKTLISEIRQVICAPNCPVCGSSFDSNEQLLHKIDLEIGTESLRIKELNLSLKQEKEKCILLEQSLASERSEYEGSKKVLEKVRREFEESCEKIKIYQLDLSQAGFSQPGEEELVDEINSSINRQKLELQQLNIQVQESEQIHDGVKNKLKKTISLSKELGQNLIQIKSQIDQEEKTIAELLEQAIKRNLSFEISQNDLISRLRDAGEELENLTSHRSEIYENINTIRQKLGKVKNQQVLVEDSLNEALKQKKDLVFNLKRLDAELLKTGFNQEVDPIVLQRDVDSLVAYISKVTFFREKILVAEIVADSEEKTAVVTRLIDKKSKLLNQKRTLKNDLENNKIKLATLKSIQNYLDIIQQNSMETYFKAIGPMATLIQSKLRPVYGFGDMSIDYSEKNVTVKVDWQKSSNSLRPSDYFSESQVGILALSIFFSIAFTQTWSGLRTIMLDDPVLNFDDLNVYAFADLLRSWLATFERENRPQIIISTCDDRLLRILRSKFQPLIDKGDAKFYIYKSLSKQGPIIEMVDNDKPGTLN